MMVACICFTVILSLLTGKSYQDVSRVQLMWHLMSASALIQLYKMHFRRQIDITVSQLEAL